jgi:hypothetical protein
MLGVPPIQKPDAYIHFAPNRSGELKYCVSVSASRKRRVSSPVMLSESQAHFGIAIAIPYAHDPQRELLTIGMERLLTGGGFRHRRFPQIFVNKPLVVKFTPWLFLDQGSRDELMYDRRAFAGVVAPFDTASVQLAVEKPTEVISRRTRLTWTYQRATSLNGVSVYEVLAEAMIGGPNMVHRSFQAKFWFRIKDSSVERFEMITPSTHANLGGYRFVMTRIN